MVWVGRLSECRRGVWISGRADVGRGLAEELPCGQGWLPAWAERKGDGESVRLVALTDWLM